MEYKRDMDSPHLDWTCGGHSTGFNLDAAAQQVRLAHLLFSEERVVIHHLAFQDLGLSACHDAVRDNTQKEKTKICRHNRGKYNLLKLHELLARDACRVSATL